MGGGQRKLAVSSGEDGFVGRRRRCGRCGGSGWLDSGGWYSRRGWLGRRRWLDHGSGGNGNGRFRLTHNFWLLLAGGEEEEEEKEVKGGKRPF